MSATLGELIDWLKRCPPDAYVRYSDGSLPEAIHSWRGVYAELALSCDGDSAPTVANLLEMLQDAVGQTYTGYKGGEYKMCSGTEIHCDNYGDYTERPILGGHCIGRDAVIVIPDLINEKWTAAP